MILLWRLLAILCIVLGLIGVVVPVMPTTPFLLLAAWAASRGWPSLERWMLAHSVWGPMILRWRERRAVPRRAKWLATLGMAGSGIMVVLWLQHPPWLRAGVPLVMLCVAVWLWRRPDA